MFKKKQQPIESPSMDSLPQFIKSPTVPRFNSPFPPLHPDKKYRGVYERAGFDVYKGNYENHKHSHDINHPSECNSMNNSRSANNSPSPVTNGKFPRNFTAPAPFATQKNHQSDPNLPNTKRYSQSSKESNPMSRQRNFSESSPYSQRPPNTVKTSSSSTNFNYVSAYSTPVVDDLLNKKNEDIRMNNYVTPVQEYFDKDDRPFQHDDKQDNTGSPEKNFHSLNNGANGIDTFGNKEIETPYLQPYNETYYEAPSTSGLNINDNSRFGHESVTSSYPDDGLIDLHVPRLSELIEEEVGATPKVPRLSDEYDGKFYDASPVLENNEQFESVVPPPEIVVEEDYDFKQRELDKKKPTLSTYFNRDQAYDLLTGGDAPTRTPEIPSYPFNAVNEPPQDDVRSFSAGPEDDIYNTTNPTVTTTARTSNSGLTIENEIDSLTRKLSGSDLQEAKEQQISDKYVHYKIRPPQLDQLTEPLTISKSSMEQDNYDEPKEPPAVVYPSGSGPCRKCGLEITGKSIWSKDSQLSGQWHRNCFSCHKCSKPFNKGTNCYVIQDHPYCEQHFHELNNSLCKTCGNGIEGTCLENEKSEKFHPHCLSCSKCGLFIDKDYFIVDGSPLCEKDGLIEIEKERNMLFGTGGDPMSKIEKRRTRLLQI